MALDGVSAVTPPEASNENTFGRDGADEVPVFRVKVFPRTHVSVTVSITLNWSPFVRCLVSSRRKVNLRTVLIRENTTENNNIYSHAQDTTAVHPHEL